uniref:Leucine-rich repeat-containing protein n=1 Tax=Tanacetum cinerariifolium TaxID=118510 RepID=A0A699KT82_TANCI|nr:leucine-rich repeat-containing protein [Tanacetum cinerariifolium]
MSSSLTLMDLGKNLFQGTILNVFEEFTQLEGLILNGNQLEGEVPHSLSNCRSLKVLDIGNNKLNGTLPEWLGGHAKHGKISTEPEYMFICGNYYSIIEGEIPNTIGSLNSLKVLKLSHNNLNGGIPNALGNISRIESLDLSWNQLIEEIPQSLAEIKGLTALNLSKNRLVGSIPNGTQFNIFDESSFEGNLGLCGLSLTKICNEHTHKPLLESQEEESGFTWEVVTLGYGCGTLLGLVMGYLMLSTRKFK